MLSPEALCPLTEPLPPDSAVAEGVVTAGLIIELTACLLEGEGGLRRRKAIKNKRKILEKYQSILTCHYFQQKRFRVIVESTAGSSATQPRTSNAV